MDQNQELHGGGYSPDVLGEPLGPPAIGAAIEDGTVQLDGSVVITYTHFSLALSTSRRFARCVAWNIDGGNRLDRGHLARRADLVWGDLSEAESANNDSFFFTNIAPHMDDFNQSSKNGVWGQLEEAVFADVDVQDLKISVFGGPVFQDNDREYRGVRLPREYWKILAYVEQGVFKSDAFLLTQNLNPFEALDLDEFRAFQVSTAELEARTGLQFADALRGADAFMPLPGPGDREPLGSPADIQW